MFPIETFGRLIVVVSGYNFFSVFRSLVSSIAALVAKATELSFTHSPQTYTQSDKR